MNELYSEHPAMFKNNPVGFVIAVLLIGVKRQTPLHQPNRLPTSATDNNRTISYDLRPTSRTERGCIGETDARRGGEWKLLKFLLKGVNSAFFCKNLTFI